MKRKVSESCLSSGWSFIRWSVVKVVFHQVVFFRVVFHLVVFWQGAFHLVVFCQGGLPPGGLSSPWPFIKVVFGQGGISLGWSFIRFCFCQGGLFISVVFHQCGHSSEWSFISVVFHQCGHSSEWSFIYVVFHQCGLSSVWSFVRVVFHQCGLLSEWSFILVVFNQCGLLSEWSFISVVFHKILFLSVWSFINVVFHQCGLSSEWSFISVVFHKILFFVKVVFSSGWSFINVVIHESGLSSVWSFVRVVFHQCILSSGSSFVRGFTVGKKASKDTYPNCDGRQGWFQNWSWLWCQRWADGGWRRRRGLAGRGRSFRDQEGAAALWSWRVSPSQAPTSSGDCPETSGRQTCSFSLDCAAHLQEPWEHPETLSGYLCQRSLVRGPSESRSGWWAVRTDVTALSSCCRTSGSVSPCFVSWAPVCSSFSPYCADCSAWRCLSSERSSAWARSCPSRCCGSCRCRDWGQSCRQASSPSDPWSRCACCWPVSSCCPWWRMESSSESHPGLEWDWQPLTCCSCWCALISWALSCVETWGVCSLAARCSHPWQTHHFSGGGSRWNWSWLPVQSHHHCHQSGRTWRTKGHESGAPCRCCRGSLRKSWLGFRPCHSGHPQGMESTWLCAASCLHPTTRGGASAGVSREGSCPARFDPAEQ